MKDIKYSAPWYYKKIGEYNGYNVVEMWGTKSYTNMSATTADGSLYRSSSQVFSEITPFTIEEVLDVSWSCCKLSGSIHFAAGDQVGTKFSYYLYAGASKTGFGGKISCRAVVLTTDDI